MEDTLRDKDLVCYIENNTYVLILVLMEDTLRAHQVKDKKGNWTVLILVLMEDTLRATLELLKKGKEVS